MFRFILAAAILTLSPMIADAGGGGSKQRTGSVKVVNPYDISIPTAVVTKAQFDQLSNLLSQGLLDQAEALFISFGPTTIDDESDHVFENLRRGDYYAVGDDGFDSYASSKFSVIAGQQATATLVKL